MPLVGDRIRSVAALIAVAPLLVTANPAAPARRAGVLLTGATMGVRRETPACGRQAGTELQ
jgi:hypothetical protein